MSATSVLHQPGTTFLRSINGINAPWASGMTNGTGPFGPNGVGNPTANALPGLGGTSSYDHARRPNLGAYDRVNFHLLMDSEKFEQHHLSSKQLAFTFRDGRGIVTDSMGEASLNEYLSRPENEEAYGRPFSAQPLRDCVNFYGVPIGNTAADLMTITEKCQAYTIRKEVRVHMNTTQLEQHSRGVPVVTLGDHLYEICRKEKVVDERMKIFRVQPGVSPTDRWRRQFYPYISKDRLPPPTEVYSNRDGLGFAIFIGSIHALYGPTTYGAETIVDARNAYHPKADNSAYLETLKNGYEFGVAIGVH